MSADLSEFLYGIKEKRTDGFGDGIVFAWFRFRDDRDVAMKAIRTTESDDMKEMVRIVPVRRKGAL